MLPSYQGQIDNFSFDLNQKHTRPLGTNSTILKRALWQKNVKVDSWRNDKGQSVWVAQGALKSLRFIRCVPSLTSKKTKRIVDNKVETKKFLSEAGVKVPRGISLLPNEEAKAVKFYQSLGSTVVVKPRNGSGGKGITAGITSKKGMLEALGLIDIGKQAIIEEHIPGNDHRILVIGGKVAAVQIRHPAFVVGDGVRTISELIEEKNKERVKNPYNGKYLLSFNKDSESILKAIGLNKDSILSDGYKLQLRSVANIGAGGDSEDVTHKIHPDFIEVAVNCWKAFSDLYYCGVDLIAEDISRPAAEQQHAVVEINVNCDISIHHFPTIGQPLNVAKSLADYLFPDEPVFEIKAYEILIKGGVQKVGFRNWVQRQAMLLGVSGSCENIKGGGVKVVVEGSPASIDEMKRLCAIGPAKSSPSSLSFKEVKVSNLNSFDVV